jgi:hypothetical protein
MITQRTFAVIVWSILAALLLLDACREIKNNPPYQRDRINHESR